MPKNSGVDLSSKYDDLGDFDFNIDESGTKRDQVAQPSKIRSDYIPEMKSGFLSGLKQEIERQMPFTASSIQELTDITSNVKSMTQDFSKEAAPYLRSIGRSTNRLMPVMQPFIPKKLYSVITGKLSQIPDEETGEMSEEERQNQQIAADINATFQTSDAKAQIRSSMSDASATLRHTSTMRAFSGLAREMRYITTFMSSSMIAYMKKDLEIQYRQLHAQRDIGATLRATAKLLDVELKNITHNTGLPETIKAKDFEHRTTRSETLREYTANYWKKFFSNLKTNVLDQISEGLAGVEMAASGGADAVEMMQEMGQKVDPKNFITKMMFRYLGNAAGSKLVGKSAGILKHFTGGIESGMENLHENLIRGITKYSNSATGFLPWLLGAGMPTEHQQNFKIGNVLGESPLKTVQFDISSQAALTTIIPGYLGQILQTVSDIKDPKTNHQLVVFDSKKMRFVNRDSLQARTEDYTKQIFTPKIYGSDNQLGVLSAGRVIRGEKGEDIKKWLLEKNKDGKTNREKVTRFFINIARLPSHEFDTELLERNLDNKDISVESDRYWQEATRGLGNNSQAIVRWILDSVTNADGSYNKILVNKYQALVDKMSHDVDVNEVSNKFTYMMNESAPEIRSMMLEYAKKNGLYDEDRGELVRDSMNEHLAKSMSSEKFEVSQWDTDKYVDATMSNKWSFSLPDIVYRLLGKAGDRINPLASKVGTRLDKMQKDLAAVFADTGNNVKAWGTSTAKSIFGENAVKSFDAMSDAVLGRYKSEGGLQMMALDVALLSDTVEESDKEIVRQFTEAAIHAEKDSDIAKQRIVAIAAIKNETVRDLFSEATQYIVTKRDAVATFGDIKERLALLQTDEHVEKLKTEFKSRIGKITSKAKEKAIVAKEAIAAAVKESGNTIEPGTFAKAVKRGKEKAEELWSSVTAHASGFSKKVGKTVEGSVGHLNEINLNVSKIYKLLHATFSSNEVIPEDTPKAPTKRSRKSKPVAEKQETASTKSKDKASDKKLDKEESQGTFKSIMSHFSGASRAILQRFNPLASPAGKIGAKYPIDFSTPESRFHADFLKFFAYKKDMDALMAKYAKDSSFFGSMTALAKTTLGTGGTIAHALIGASGTAIGGIARGAGSLGSGIVKSLFYKVQTGNLFFDIYRRDELSKDKNAVPLVTTEQQESGLWLLRNDGKKRNLVRLRFSAEINVPLYSSDKKEVLISNADINAGLVNIKGVPIRKLVPHEYSGLVPTLARGAFGVSKIGYDVTKEGVSLTASAAKKVLVSPLKAGYRSIAEWEENKKKKKTSLLFYDVYRADKKVLGHPLLSAKKQKDGEVLDAQTGKRIRRTIDINGPVIDSITKQTLISEEDIEAGLITFDGVKLSELASLNVARGNTFGESMGKGFENLSGFLKNSAGGVGHLLDISKIFAGAGGAVLKGTAAVGLHAADFGISALERLFGFDNMTARRFEKKYKPLLSRMDVMSIYLKEISENTKPKHVDFDTDNNGIRDGAAITDEDYASQKSGIDGEAISSADKRKKKPAETTTSMLKSLLNFFKDPKGHLMSKITDLWSGTKELIKGVGWMAKSIFWTIPKAILWDLPVWTATVGFPTTWAAILKGGRGFKNLIGNAGKLLKGNLGTLTTVAGAGIAGVAAYNMLKGYKDESGNVTKESLDSIAGSHSTKQTGTNIYRSGKLITAIEHGKNAAAILPNVADESSMFAQLLKKCKFDKMLEYCSGKWASIKDIVSSFIKKLSSLKPKSLTAVVSWFKRVFTVAKSSKIGVWIKYLRMFSFLKGACRIFMVGLNYLFEPAMMALDGYIRSEVMKAAAETNDPSLIDEYEEQNKLGFGRILGAVLTGGLSEVYNLSASATSQLAAATIETQISKTKMSMLRTKRSLALKKEATEAKKKGNVEYADNLDKINRQFADLKVDSDSSWFNSFGSTREGERANKRDNAIVFAKTILERLSKNYILLPKMVTVLSTDLIENFTKRDAVSGHGVGAVRNKIISKIADAKALKDLIVIFTDFTFISTLEIPGVRDMMIAFLSDKGCSVKDILTYAKEQDVVVDKAVVEQEKKQASDLIKPAPKVDITKSSEKKPEVKQIKVDGLSINVDSKGKLSTNPTLAPDKVVPESFQKQQTSPTSLQQETPKTPVVDKRISDLEAQVDFLKKALNITNSNEAMAASLKALVELQTKNNDIVEKNGEKQDNSINLVGSVLDKFGKQQASVMSKVSSYGLPKPEPREIKPALQSIQGIPQGGY